jgi:hypothetical protein
VNPRHDPARRAGWALDGIALLVLALVVVSSVARPLFYWDSWAYHLPFSALIWNIGDASRAFVLSDEMRWRFEGFPLFAELVQGALWKLTGSINATPLINSLALAGFVLAAAKSLRLSLALLAFSVLAVPLVALHSITNYIDLFVGVCVCFQVLAAVKLLADAEPGPAVVARNAGDAACGLRTKEPARRAVWIAVYVAAAAAAGNAKFTALIFSLAISAFVLAHLLLRRRAVHRTRAKLVVLAVALASVLAAGTALKNACRFSNPFHPVDTHVMGVHLAGPEPEYRNYPDYTAGLGVLARPANWALSISDIDWVVRGVDGKYSLDLATGDKPKRYGPARSGGYWGPLVLVAVFLVIGLAMLAARRNRAALRSNRFLLALFAWLSLVTAFMPQSHELRYALHWPLLLMLVLAVLVSAAQLSSKARLALATGYLGAFLVSQSMLGFPVRPWPVTSQQDIVAGESSAPEIEHARKTGGVCLGPEYKPRQFAYSSVFHGGVYVIEQGWTRCAAYPRYRDGK